MTSNVAQHQTELSADIKLVNELIELTQTGVDFYTRANTTVDDYSLKRIFIAQINTYQGMLARFRQLLAQSLQYIGPHSVPPSQTRPYADVDALLIKQQLADALPRILLGYKSIWIPYTCVAKPCKAAMPANNAAN